MKYIYVRFGTCIQSTVHLCACSGVSEKNHVQLNKTRWSPSFPKIEFFFKSKKPFFQLLAICSRNVLDKFCKKLSKTRENQIHKTISNSCRSPLVSSKRINFFHKLKLYSRL